MNSERACLALGACLGQWSIHDTAEHICLSQSYRSGRILLEIFLELANPKNNEVIMNRVHKTLSLRSPNPQTDCAYVEHWQKMVEKRAPFRFCTVPESHAFDGVIQGLPENVCLVVIHMDPAQENIYVVVVDRNTYAAGAKSDHPACSGISLDRLSIYDKGGLDRALKLMRNFSSNPVIPVKNDEEGPHQASDSESPADIEKAAWEECVTTVRHLKEHMCYQSVCLCLSSLLLAGAIQAIQLVMLLCACQNVDFGFYGLVPLLRENV